MVFLFNNIASNFFAILHKYVAFACSVGFRLCNALVLQFIYFIGIFFSNIEEYALQLLWTSLIKKVLLQTSIF